MLNLSSAPSAAPFVAPSIVIVSPASADANNGNWQTARRWQLMLQSRYSVRIVKHWVPGSSATNDRVMLALHARRSADSIAAWAGTGAGVGLAVVLTGTDLYRDIESDPAAQASLRLANQLVVLQERGIDALPEAVRGKARVIFQSCDERATLAKTEAHLRVTMVGHLRDEKSPDTLFAAAQLLNASDGIYIDHIGAPLDAALAAQARATAAACPHYRWLDAQPHEATRRHIQRAHVLVHCSKMEGGAHVVLEAVRSGTPVVASRIPGNVGMLGADYSGYFDWGDAQGLADVLHRLATDNRLMDLLKKQCAERAALFAPEAEHDALHHLVVDLLIG
jgi:putative glycosyltransferase (TIGR04348 family)